MASRKWKPSASHVRPHYEDDELRNDLKSILAGLPADDAARRAFEADRPSLEIQRLVSQELVERITEAYNRWRERDWARREPSHFNPYRQS